MFRSLLLRSLVPVALSASVVLSGSAASASASPTPSASPSASSPTTVEVIPVQGAIDEPLLDWLNSELTKAQNEGAVVVLQLNTSGSMGTDAVALARRVADLSVPVVVFVGPAPAKAQGVGLLLMYASSLAAVAPGSQTGPLAPLDLADPQPVPSDLDAEISGWLEARGKTTTNFTWNDRPLDGSEARHREVAQTAALSVIGLLNRIDGKTVMTPSGSVTLHTHVAADESQVASGTVDIRFENMPILTRVEHGVASPSMAYFLLILGLACLAFEMTQPGFGFAGFSGIALLLLAAYALTVIPVWWPGSVLMIIGVVLMVADVRLRRLGWLSGVGIVAFAAGSFTTWHDVAGPIRVSPWLIGGAIIASALYYGFGLTVALQSRDRVLDAQRGLVGLIGEARGRLAPDGPVFVKGALWRGRTTGEPIEPGSKVRVRAVDGMILNVDRETEQP